MTGSVHLSPSFVGRRWVVTSPEPPCLLKCMQETTRSRRTDRGGIRGMERQCGRGEEDVPFPFRRRAVEEEEEPVVVAVKRCCNISIIIFLAISRSSSRRLRGKAAVAATNTQQTEHDKWNRKKWPDLAATTIRSGMSSISFILSATLAVRRFFLEFLVFPL